jgi:hypothetical protein
MSVNRSDNQLVYPRWIIDLRIRQCKIINLLKPAGYVMHQQFNIQHLYALPTMYLCFVFI